MYRKGQGRARIYQTFFVFCRKMALMLNRFMFSSWENFISFVVCVCLQAFNLIQDIIFDSLILTYLISQSKPISLATITAILEGGEIGW